MKALILLQVVLAALRALTTIWKAKGPPAPPKALEELPEPPRAPRERPEVEVHVVHYDD